jgi:hypothetical protein
MIMTCCIECAFQKNHRKRKGKVVVYDDGDVFTSDEEDFDGDADVDDGDGANADVAIICLPRTDGMSVLLVFFWIEIRM